MKRMLSGGLVVLCLFGSSVVAAQQTEPESREVAKPAAGDSSNVEVEQSSETETVASAPASDVPEPTEDMVQKLAENELAAKRALASEPDAQPQRALSIRTAVYNLELRDIPESMGRVVTDALLAEVRKLEGISAIGMEEITQMISLEAQKQMMGCEASESCLAQIAGALGVDELITGNLTELEGSRILTIRRIDQRRAKGVGTIQERLEAGSGEEFLLAIGPSVEKLYPGRAYRPGTTKGVPEKLVLRLNPPPVAKWITQTVGWAGAGAALLGGLTYLRTWQEHSRYSDQLDGSRSSYLVGDYATSLSNNGQALEKASFGLVVSGAILGAAFGALYALTDWDGYAEGYANED